MTQHTELIERLIGLAETAHSYYEGSSFDAVAKAAFKDALSDALEAQAREIAELKAQESELCTLYGLAQAECQKLRAEVDGLRAARMAYASEFPPDGEGEPDVGSIHQNIRAMKAEIDGLRKDAERYRLLRECGVDSYEACGSGDKLDAECDAAIAMKGQP